VPFSAPEEIRTPDPQIRSLVLNKHPPSDGFRKDREFRSKVSNRRTLTSRLGARRLRQNVLALPLKASMCVSNGDDDSWP
jgi:hypothetical protein